MIDLTPLDVRNKRGDFKGVFRGYDRQEVDTFLELVSERMGTLVREILQLRERSETLQEQVTAQGGRERAVQEALVTAQEFRSEIRSQAQREAELIIQEAQAEARSQRAKAEAEVRMMLRDAERRLERGRDGLEEMERRRHRFLKSFRQLLEREMDVVEVEEGTAPLEDRPGDLDLGGGRSRSLATDVETEDAASKDISELAPDDDDDDRPPLDASVDQLAAHYESVESSADEQDPFSLPDTESEDGEDSRWS